MKPENTFQGLKFEVMSSTFEENLDKNSFSHPADYVKETARHKTMEVAQKLASQPVSFTSNIHYVIRWTHLESGQNVCHTLCYRRFTVKK